MKWISLLKAFPSRLFLRKNKQTALGVWDLAWRKRRCCASMEVDCLEVPWAEHTSRKRLPWQLLELYNSDSSQRVGWFVAEFGGEDFFVAGRWPAILVVMARFFSKWWTWQKACQRKALTPCSHISSSPLQYSCTSASSEGGSNSLYSAWRSYYLGSWKGWIPADYTKVKLRSSSQIGTKSPGSNPMKKDFP